MVASPQLNMLCREKLQHVAMMSMSALKRFTLKMMHFEDNAFFISNVS